MVDLSHFCTFLIPGQAGGWRDTLPLSNLDSPGSQVSQGCSTSYRATQNLHSASCDGPDPLLPLLSPSACPIGQGLQGHPQEAALRFFVFIPALEECSLGWIWGSQGPFMPLQPFFRCKGRSVRISPWYQTLNITVL